MSVITFPAALSTYVKKCTMSIVRLDLAFTSMLGAQAVEVGVPLWGMKLELDTMLHAQAGEAEALAAKLKGQTNQLAMYNAGRPAPVGTMRGTMTLNTSALAGDTSLVITAGVGQANKTLLAGDLIGIGSGTTTQLLMVTDAATANGSGVITVSVHAPLRNAFSAGAAVTWDKPVALFRRVKSVYSWTHDAMFSSGHVLEMIEDVRA